VRTDDTAAILKSKGKEQKAKGKRSVLSFFLYPSGVLIALKTLI
jgi:hypothetical protein